MNIKICLDAGHFADYNRSPVVPDYWESRMTWELHLKLKAELEKYGFEVITTREDQKRDLEVYERGKKSRGCDLFISLHSNACNDERVERVSVFHSFDNRNNSVVLCKQLADTVRDVMHVSESRVCTRIGITGTNEYYGVLRGARNVGTPLYYIIEHSFHTNAKAAKWLLDDSNLSKLAKAEAETIAKYYGASKKGDVNGDGNVDALDYQIVKAAALGQDVPEDLKARSDLDGDGKVTAFDYLIEKRFVLDDK